MFNQPRTHIIASTQDLEHSRGKGLLSDFAELQCRIRRIGAVLADDHITRNDGLEDLDSHYSNRQIPRADGTDNSNREIPPNC